MGNRAVIVSKNDIIKVGGVKTIKPTAIGVYLHWNGGQDSVRGFLEYCKALEFRSTEYDRHYGFARLTQIAANFFDDGLCIGTDLALNLDYDNGDNGVYVIDEWNIVDRLYFEGEEQNRFPLKEMMMSIAERQPKAFKLTEKQIDKYIKKIGGKK